MKEGWDYKELGECCDILDSKRKPITKNKRILGDIPYYGATGILDYVKDYIFDEKLVLIGEDGAKWGAGENTAYIIDGKSWVNNHAHAIRPNRQCIIDEFLVFYLNYSDLSDKITGVTVPKLNQEKMRGIILPVPSLSEQQQIVSFLDSEFEKIDALKANAETQLQAAKDLFQKALKEMLTPKEGWEKKTLDEISYDMFRGSGITREQIRNEGIACVRYGEIYTTYNYGFENCVSHTDEQIIKSPKYFEHGDILFAITGESVEDIGKSIAYLGNEKCMAGGDIVVMKHNENPKYLSYALATPDAVAQKGFGKTKLKVVHTSIPSLKTIVVPIPSLKEQQVIADNLDTLSAKVKQLQENYNETITLCNDLKQSLLKRIFE